MSPTLSPSPFGSARTLVVKLGSAVLTTGVGEIDLAVLHEVCTETAALIQSGRNVIIVTSGAVAAGRGALNIRSRRATIAEKQALAAVGQSRLMGIYAEFFGQHGIHIGQMLLTAGDMEDRRRYVNARYTLEELLRRRCVPVINENDTVTVDELRFGDNDGLAARVAAKMQAGALILMSDVAGLYDSNPKTNRNAKLIEVVENVTPAVVQQYCPAEGQGSAVGSGGMLSKLQAAKLATASGVCVAIANGKKRGMLASILAGEFEGTFFPAVEARRSRRRQWILHGRIAGGRQVIVDDGARTALFTHKKSLLPAGIRDVAGTFSPGDVVDIVDTAGKLLGRGVVNYSSPELRSIMGRKTTEIAGILGSKPYDEAVHRDNLVLVEEE